MDSSSQVGGGETVKKLLMGLFLLALLSGQVQAVPSLQLFSPDAHYDAQNSYWVSIVEPFELWVAGAQSPEWVHEVSNVSLLVAVPAAFWDPTAKISIDSITSARAVDADTNPASLSLTLTAANLTSVDGDGNPIATTPDALDIFSNFPDHGVYPAYFWQVPLANLMIGTVQEDVYDFGEDFDLANLPSSAPDVGDVQYYQVSYSPYRPDFMFEIDLIGLAHNGHTQWRFAPFSHTAVAWPLPEPSTLVLLGLSLAGMGLLKRRSRKAS